MYSQAIDSFKSDADAARLALVDDISRVRDELVSLQLTIKDVETSGIDVRQMERDAVTKALSLIKELGPFLTHEMIPKLPSQADGREDPSVGLDDLSSLTEWIGQATVSAGEVLRMAIERESKSAVFVEADKIVDLVKRVGAP